MAPRRIDSHGWRQARSCPCDVIVERQLGAFGSLALGQRLVQGLLHPTPRISLLDEPEQTTFGLLDDGHGAVLLLYLGLIRIPQDIPTQSNQLAAHM